MKITMEINFETYETRKSAQSFLNRIVCEGKAELLDAVLTDMYPDGINESELDDILDYNEEDVCRWLDMRTEEDVRSDIRDKEAEIEDAQDSIKELEEEIASWERELYEDEDADTNDIQSKIDEIEIEINDYEHDIEAYTEELDELKEELDDILSY